MARYREKDATDLAWNRTRRQITMEIDLVIRNLREEILNKALTQAFEEHVARLNAGEIVAALPSGPAEWVTKIIAENVPVPLLELSDAGRS
ncbi:MAG TPA: hypothetical protein VNN79_03355 [Actinomycetota bacterium]|nr:hypothetical protein [Actinomycetota bacterium]